MASNSITFPVIKIKQTLFDMYVGVISAQQLYQMSKSDTLRLEKLEIPKYAGFQRALVEERVSSIKDYLNTPNCVLPNSIIVSMDSDFIESWEEIGDGAGTISSLKVTVDSNVFTVIDGQHRTAALDAAYSEFEVILTIFIDLDIKESARMFAKINSTQKPVNPSIAFQLFGYSEYRSPQKTAHDIAETLNNTEGSPFHRRLRLLGTKTEWKKSTLSQNTFCKYLMPLYSKKWERDENALLRGEALESDADVPLRNFFIEKKDVEILNITWKFFYNIASVWETQCNDESGSSILVKTTGYIAFIHILKRWLLNEENASEVLNDSGSRQRLESIKEKYEMPEFKFISKNYPAGSQGVIKLEGQLMADLELLP